MSASFFRLFGARTVLGRSTNEFRATFPNAVGEDEAFFVAPMGEALVAVWWPAGRASRVDPLEALRFE